MTLPPRENWKKHAQTEAPRSEVFVDHPCNSVDMLFLLEREISMVDGFLANLGVRIVSLFLSSLPATGLPVLSYRVPICSI